MFCSKCEEGKREGEKMSGLYTGTHGLIQNCNVKVL